MSVFGTRVEPINPLSADTSVTTGTLCCWACAPAEIEMAASAASELRSMVVSFIRSCPLGVVELATGHFFPLRTRGWLDPSKYLVRFWAQQNSVKCSFGAPTRDPV